MIGPRQKKTSSMAFLPSSSHGMAQQTSDLWEDSPGYMWRGLATSQRDIVAEKNVDGSARVKHGKGYPLTCTVTASLGQWCVIVGSHCLRNRTCVQVMKLRGKASARRMSPKQNADNQTIGWQEIMVRENSVSGNDGIVNNQVWYLCRNAMQTKTPTNAITNAVVMVS